MERVEIQTTLTQADWHAYQVHWSERNLGDQRKQGLIAVLLGALTVIVAASLADYFDRPLSMPSLLAGIVLATAGSFYNAFRARRSARPDPDGFVLGPSSIVLSGTDIEIVKAGSRSRYAWSIVQDLAWTDQHLFVWLDPVAAFIVPLRDLPAGLDPAQLKEKIHAFRSAHAQYTSEPAPFAAEEESAALPDDASPSGQQTTPPEPAPFKRFMRAYATLLVGRTPAADDLTIPSKLVLLLPAVGLAMWLIVDRWRAGADAEFMPYGVFAWSWYAVTLLASLWAASRLVRPSVSYERILVLAAAFIPVVLMLGFAQEQWVRPDWAFVISLAIVSYAVLYVARILRSLTGRPQAKAAWTFAAILCAAVWLTDSLHFSGTFWYSREESEEAGSDYWADMRQSEALMYAQPKRIESAVSALQRPDDLAATAFFVGFAGQGDQRVFAGEIALARRVVAAKFGSAQRSVLLVNDRRDLQTLPLASPTALRYALNAIAARMRLESDVLFLSLSSHGSENGEISVRNGMLALNDLSATDLAAALRESGIKWKVIVVSACYAGKFIEPLRDDNTIIIAAAAADRTSFGCSDDRELTYFGEAFYRDALPAASDLKTAFEKASAEIAARERAEGKEASNPQAHFGRALVEHLRSDFPGS